MATLCSRFAPEAPASPSGRFCAKPVQTVSGIQPKKEVIFCEEMAKDSEPCSDYRCGSSGIFRLFPGAKRVLPMQQLQIPCGMFD